MAGDDDSIRSRDSKELDPPPPKKAKIESDTEANAPADSSFSKGRQIRRGELDDPEFRRQLYLFCNQFEDSEGFDVDWDSYDYVFTAVNFDWQAPNYDDNRSNEELIQLLIQAAIKDHDKNYGTKLVFDKYVSANILPCKGLIYFITFLAKDLFSSDQEIKPYQAKVWMFREEISVEMVRLRPSQKPNC